MGSVLRLNMVFAAPFWEKSLGAGNIFIQNTTPLACPYRFQFRTWWTFQIGDAFGMVAWIGGPKAKESSELSSESLLGLALEDLATMFRLPVNDLLKALITWRFHNWQTDPFSLGGYSYLGIGGIRAMKELVKPIQDTLYFAGEGFTEGPSRGTVHAALETGIAAAKTILAERPDGCA